MPTPRTTVRRRSQRGVYDRAVVDAILDEGKVCHVALAGDEGPIVLPTGYVRIGDEVVLHGAVANALMRQAADGRPLCIAVTLLDGYVLARSTFNHSMNYRSVVVFGRARVLEGEEKAAALATFVDHIVPGRSAEARAANESELRATLALAVSMDEVSAKVRTGPPHDDDVDLALPVWAGVVPLASVVGEPEPGPDLSPDIPLPPSVRKLCGVPGA